MLIGDGSWTALRWIWALLGVAIVLGAIALIARKTSWRPGILARPLAALVILAIVAFAMIPEFALKHARTAWIVFATPKGPATREASVFFGSAKTTLHDGTTVSLPGRDEKNELSPMPLIVNDSGQPLSVEQVSYGYPGHDPAPVDVPPDGVLESPCGRPALVHEVPGSVSTEYGAPTTRCWVVW